MKKYYMYDFNEIKELFIGEFESENEFWKYYWEHESEIKAKQEQLNPSCRLWYVAIF